VLNASAHRVVELALIGKGGGRVPLQQIAQDGVNYGVSIARSSILLAPGNRIEVLVRIDRVGAYDLKALAYDQGHPGGPRPEILLANVRAVGPRMHSAVTFPLQLIAPSRTPSRALRPPGCRSCPWPGRDRS
jgi:FtsP/CotA-like multicopper oxidase with cupredoxin domain